MAFSTHFGVTPNGIFAFELKPLGSRGAGMHTFTTAGFVAISLSYVVEKSSNTGSTFLQAKSSFLLAAIRLRGEPIRPSPKLGRVDEATCKQFPQLKKHLAFRLGACNDLAGVLQLICGDHRPRAGRWAAECGAFHLTFLCF
jgi:hypothetical protein